VAVKVSHQRANVAGRKAAVFAVLDEGLYTGRKRVGRALINGVHCAGFGRLDVGVRQKKFAQAGLVGKAVDAVAGGVHEHGAGAVNDVAGRYLVGAALEAVGYGTWPAGGRNAAVDAENGADADIDVNIARPVERVDGHYVLALVIAGLNHVIVLLGDDGADFAAVAQGPDETDVGDYIELLLVFALHILAA
nr:hypothetical protein [Tanacetum cinerariifolium]